MTFNPPHSEFSACLVGRNGLEAAGFREWVFHPAMLFGALRTWWGGGADRDWPHEGLDICCYRDAHSLIHRLAARFRVPAMYEGEVAAIQDDFLGESIFVRHSARDGDGRVRHTVYGHTAPDGDVGVGAALKEGEVFATIAEPCVKGGAPPHLHLTVAWVPPSDSHVALNWSAMSDARRVVLVDPLRVASFPHVVLPHVL